MALAAAAMALAPPVGAADSLSSVRSELVTETTHAVDVVVHRGHLALDVTRTVHNGGEKADQATWVLDLPSGAVATGLRSLGALRGEPRWWSADLYEAELAARLYRELTGLGGYTPKDPALLSWRAAGTLVLQVFPVAKDTDKTVAYSLVLPSEWRDGADRRTLAPMGLAGTAVHARFRPARADDVVFVDGQKVAETDDVTLDHAVEVVLRRAAPPPIEASLAVAGAGQRGVVHLAIDAAPRLSTVPSGAYIVVVLDVSRSMHDRVASAAAAARAYLTHMPDARVEIVTFSRRADRLLGGFASVATASEALLAAGSIRQNGSHLDVGLAEADALLATAPAGAPRRMLLLTDRETRSALDADRIRASLRKSGALLHVGIPYGDTPHLTEHDDALLGAAVRATGGVVWHAGTTTDHRFAREMERTYEEWARPLRLQDVVVRSTSGDETAPVGATLEEGQSLEATWVADKPPKGFALEGRFWAQPFRRALSPDEAYGRLWSALAFGEGVYSSLSEPEMMELARRGGAVSPVTSYLAIEPGVRPSTEGFSGHGRLGGSHRTRAPQIRMGATSVADRFDHLAFLREKLLDGLRACGAGASVSLVIETTHDEIVDVTPRSARGELAACMEEVAWAIELPREFRDAHRTFTVGL